MDHSFPVSSESSNQEQCARQARTLGDLLYLNGTNVPSELEWLKAVEAVAAGDQLALHWLYERTNRMVFTLALRITNSRETAEELTVDVFHDVWRRAFAYDASRGSVVGWIMNQARSRAIDRLRFDNRKKRVNESGETPVVVSRRDPERELEMNEQSRLLQNALEVLTPEERQAIETAFFSELTYQEAAETLNRPLGTVKTHIRSGLRKLRQKLEETLKGRVI
jgi:RNA polymerase sigma-70 factor (ECF subfamily)